MPRRVTHAEAVAAVSEVARRTADRTAFVAVDGFGAAGKTTLAAAIERSVGRVTVVHADDFARPSVPEWEWRRFAREVVAPLLAGRSARYRVWDWPTDSGGEWVVVPPGRLVLLEGVSSTRRELAVPWELTIWVDAPRDVRLARAVERDGPDLLPTWLGRWLPEEESWAARDRPRERADLLVDGAGADRPATGCRTPVPSSPP